MQYDGDPNEPGMEKYFYLHDRLGSVRMVVDDTGTVQNTYNPILTLNLCIGHIIELNIIKEI